MYWCIDWMNKYLIFLHYFIMTSKPKINYSSLAYLPSLTDFWVFGFWRNKLWDALQGLIWNLLMKIIDQVMFKPDTINLNFIGCDIIVHLPSQLQLLIHVLLKNIKSCNCQNCSNAFFNLFPCNSKLCIVTVVELIFHLLTSVFFIGLIGS